MKIKPCPFPCCGGEAKLITGATYFWVVCMECAASGPKTLMKDGAIAEWNSVKREESK